MLKQIFETERISFVEISKLLVNDYLRMVNDIEHVDRFIGGWHEPFTEEDEDRRIQKKLEEKAAAFSMIEKKSGEFIGNIELMDVSVSSGELGIAITADKQNKGYGTEAVRAMAGYGMSRSDLKEFSCGPIPAISGQSTYMKSAALRTKAN